MNPSIPGLRPGECIGIAAPAYAVDAAAVDAGRRVLEEMGYRVRLAPGITERRGYLAGEDDSRAASINALIADPSVRAILFARANSAGSLTRN